ncbi:dephospho-CoA kinase [bacterium]|nr:dephospho-CoA kinase [candidate division CSSED10-310 bacterium]
MKRVFMRKPVGLTGGIATGKSLIAGHLQKLGAMVISGDEVAHEVLSPKSPAIQSLVDSFGSHIVTSEGALNSKEMLDELISNQHNLYRQINILTPYILPAIDRKVAYAILHHPGKLVVVEAPLLFEYGRRDRYGAVIVVYAPREIQIKRLMQRSHISEKRAGQIVDIQIPVDQKIKMADYIVDNSGSFESAIEQTERLFTKLIQINR